LYILKEAIFRAEFVGFWTMYWKRQSKFQPSIEPWMLVVVRFIMI
jgi:hypothetical protein